MSSDSKRLKNFFVKIIIFTAFLPLCVSFVFLYYTIQSNQNQLMAYHLYVLERSELEIKTILTRSVDSLRKIIVSDELSQFLKSTLQTEAMSKRGLQSLFDKERLLINQSVFYCVYGSHGTLLYGETLCPPEYDTKHNQRIVFTKNFVLLNLSHVFESNVKNQFFFSAAVPFEFIYQSHPFVYSFALVSDKIDNIKLKVNLKPDVLDKKINFIFYFGIFLCSLISVVSIIYGIKIAHSLKKKAEASLQLATIGKMAHMLAHDIRKPFLNFISFMRDILACNTQNERAELIRTTEKSIQSSQIFIENLLEELIKSNENSLNINKNILLSDTIQSCLDVFPAFHANMIAIDVKLNHTLQIDVDLIKIKRAFLNIVSNAIEAVRELPDSEQKIIIIESFDNRSDVRIVFYNSNPHIEQKQLQNIFEPFYTTKQNGNGLGLFITKRIIEMHGGKISCNAKKADGVYFVVDLPASKNTESRVKSIHGVHDNVQTERFIFLIDDCPLMLRRWKRTLTQKYPHLKIQEFLNFTEFFDFIRQKKIMASHIETIICDYVFGVSDQVVFDGLKKIRTFYSKKIYIATHMQQDKVLKALACFDVILIDKELISLKSFL